MRMKKEIELSMKNNHRKRHSKTAADLNKKLSAVLSNTSPKQNQKDYS